MVWIKAIGWQIIWDRTKGPASVMVLPAYTNYVFKSAITCILLLQFQSTSEYDKSWENWEDDVDEMYRLAEKKALCMTYKFNNAKVQKIIMNQRERQHREVLVREIETAVQSMA